MADSDNSQKDTYFVALKVFLEKEGKFFIFKDRFGCWDLPGGRIKKDEFHAPLEQIIRRKLSEELGSSLEYTIEKPMLFMRHERKEQSPGNPLARIFAIGYPAKLIKGEPKMSEQHLENIWVDPKTFKPEDYFTGGWLKGVQEYLNLKQK